MNRRSPVSLFLSFRVLFPSKKGQCPVSAEIFLKGRKGRGGTGHKGSAFCQFPALFRLCCLYLFPLVSSGWSCIIPRHSRSTHLYFFFFFKTKGGALSRNIITWHTVHLFKVHCSVGLSIFADLHPLFLRL